MASLAPSIPPAAWAAIGLIAAAAVLGFLYTLAAAIRNEQSVRALREEAAELRRRYLGPDEGDEPILIVDEAPPEGTEALKTAA